MTAPRRILPGATYLITRRCTQRQFLLRPDETTAAIFGYCLAEAAARFGMRLIAFVALSNHYHLVLEDTFGLLPAFLAHFNKLTAKVLNARWQRSENLWASEQASVVRLVEPSDVLDKSVYTLANPVAADLVDRLVHWPGATSLRQGGRGPISLRRPRLFFRDRGEMPAEVELRLTAPTWWPGGDEAWNATLRAAVERREAQLREEREAAGRRIVGRKAVLRMSPFARPTSTVRRGGLRPRFACKNPARLAEEQQAWRTFRSDYAAARARLTSTGAGDGSFPLGTYKLVHEGLAQVSRVVTSRGAVIGSLFGDDDVVHVALPQTLGGDPDERCLVSEVIDRA